MTQLIRGLRHLAQFNLEHTLVSIGNFDGIHLGHQAILQRLRQYQIHTEKQPETHQACHGATRCKTLVMVFEPTPLEFFLGESAPARIMTLHEKFLFFRQHQVDYVLALAFNRALSQLTAQEFIEQILVQQLRTHTLIVGDDFRFGASRLGNFQLLQEAGRDFHFQVEDTPSVMLQQTRVSSTAIRQALGEQNLPLAQKLLGHPLDFFGRIVPGQQLGRHLGFPTLNLNPKRHKLPLLGVYQVLARLDHQGEWLPAIANFGLRPTVDGKRPSIEVHLLAWQNHWQPHHLWIRIVNFVRPEQKFDHLDALKAQIAQDVAQVRQSFGL